MKTSLHGSELGRALLGFRSELRWVILFSMFVNVLLLTPTIYLIQVYDRVLSSGNQLTLLALTMLAVLFFVVGGFADWLRSRILVRAGARLDVTLNPRVFSASFESTLAGAASGKALQGYNDMTNLRQFLTGNGVFALTDTPWTLVYIGVLYLIHPWLGLFGLVFALLMLAMAFVGHRATTRQHEATQAQLSESTNYLHSRLRNAETIEALGMLGNLRRHWLAIHDRVLTASGRATLSSQRIQAATKFVQYLQQALILALGAVLAIDGKISAGAMIACSALTGNALRPINLLVVSWRQYIETRLSYQRLEALLANNPERVATHAPQEVAGQVTLRGLSAYAPGRQKPILHDVSAEFHAGEVVAIVGPSGAGKSTLARCLVGIWPQTDGDVLLDGMPIAQWSREALGAHLGYLPQDVELLDGTIAENIARFADVPAERIVEAARRTGVHEMILRLPKGYDTPLGEAGQLLSGGQRQRVALARAVIGQPRLVVLDEPNANLDDVGEAALLEAVKELKKTGTTVFMIVHQKHMLAVVDRILTLQDGRMVSLLPVAAQKAAHDGPTTV